MHHTLERIRANPGDYKFCDDPDYDPEGVYEKCLALNWYENEACHECGESHFRDPQMQEVWNETEDWGFLCKPEDQPLPNYANIEMEV